MSPASVFIRAVRVLQPFHLPIPTGSVVSRCRCCWPGCPWISSPDRCRCFYIPRWSELERRGFFSLGCRPSGRLGGRLASRSTPGFLWRFPQARPCRWSWNMRCLRSAGSKSTTSTAQVKQGRLPMMTPILLGLQRISLAGRFPGCGWILTMMRGSRSPATPAPLERMLAHGRASFPQTPITRSIRAG